MPSIIAIYRWLNLNEQLLKRAALTSVLHEFFHLCLYIIMAGFISTLITPSELIEIKIATFSATFLAASALNALCHYFSNRFWSTVSKATCQHTQHMAQQVLAKTKQSILDSLGLKLKYCIHDANEHLAHFFAYHCSHLIKNTFGLVFITLYLFFIHPKIAMILMSLALISPTLIFLNYDKNQSNLHHSPIWIEDDSIETTTRPEPQTPTFTTESSTYLNYLINNTLSFLTLFLVGSHEFHMGNITPFDSLIILFLIPQISRLSIKFTLNLMRLQKTIAITQSMLSMIKILKENPRPQEGKFLFQKKDSIVLNGVYFTSHLNNHILEDIHLNIGLESLAIEGERGSGKSTLLKLICQLYQPSIGDIQIGSHPAQSINQILMLNDIGWVDSIDINTSVNIREFITQNQAFSDDDIQKALMPSTRSFIKTLPAQLETPINQISYDQRQKLKLTQTLLKKPILYVFDDITAHTNYQTTLEIWEIIASLLPNKRVIYAGSFIPTQLHFAKHYIIHKRRLQKNNDT